VPWPGIAKELVIGLVHRRDQHVTRGAARCQGGDHVVGLGVGDLDLGDGEQVQALLDAIHRAVLSAFGVPLRDRYQVYQEHSESNFVVQDTGLNINRTRKVVFIGITSRQRTEQQKTDLYIKLVEELKVCGIEQNDIVVSIVTNSDADWSFGNGRAQFLTGEL